MPKNYTIEHLKAFKEVLKDALYQADLKIETAIGSAYPDTASAGRSAAKRSIKELRVTLDQITADLKTLPYTDFHKKYIERL